MVTEHDDDATCHVFAGVVTDALDDRRRAGVAHRESLARGPGTVELAARRAVEDGVAHQHGLAGIAGGGAITIRPPDIDLPT